MKTQAEDGGEFYVKDMDGREWLTTIADLGQNVWENASLPENYWNKDEGYDNSTIHLPPTFAGVGNGVIDQVTQYPQLIKLGYDVATKTEVREGLWNAVKNISPSSVYSLAENAVKDKIAKYNFSDKPYLGYHEVGKDGVAVVSTIMGAGFLKAGEGAVENATKSTGEKIKEAIEKKAKEIDDFFTSKEFLDRLEDRFSKYNGQLSKAEWENRYKTLYKNREIGKLTEEQFQLLEGGLKPKKGITTSDGKRYFDNVLENMAREVKSGPITLSNSKQQILKDIEILNEDLAKGVDKIEWHCFNAVDKVEIENFINQNLKPELRDKGLFKIISY